MPKFQQFPFPSAIGLALCLVSLPALADSTSSASSAASTSVGSSSASIEKSSNSSSAKERVAQGHYTVVAVAELAQQPGMLRLQLHAVGTTQTPGGNPTATPAANTTTPEFFLTLPRAAAERAQLAAGQTVAAEQRPYGLAFARVNTNTGATSPFFLVLDDAWFRELESRPIGV